MKRITFLITTLFSYPIMACPSLEGTWLSSYDLSKSFNDERAVIEERTKEFRSQLIGKSTVTYTKDTVSLEMEPIDKVVIQGKEYPWDSSPMTSPYKVLGCTENTIVIKFSAGDTPFINKLNFENKNTYWVYEGQANGTGNDHTREYFVRAKSN